jgi:transposase InsO family protein
MQETDNDMDMKHTDNDIAEEQPSTDSDSTQERPTIPPLQDNPHLIVNEFTDHKHQDPDECPHDTKEPSEEQIPPTWPEQMALISKNFDTTNFKEWQRQDPRTLKILTALSKPDITDTDPIHDIYKLIDGILYINNLHLRKTYNRHQAKGKINELRHKWSRYVPEVIVPETTLPIKWWILSQFHGLPHTGHLGHDGTYICLRQHFYWPGIFKDVGRWIKSCLPCQQRKTGKQNRYGQHRTVLQTRPFETVSVDLVGPFAETPDGHKFILTIIDHFTRYPIAVPIKGKDMITVAKAMKTHLFMAYPFWPRKIISDKGTDFYNRVIREVYRQLNVTGILTSHDNPQANQVERFHRYMNAAISMFITKKSQTVT